MSTISIQRSLVNLENFYTFKPWGLQVQKNHVREASIIYKIYYLVISFFSSTHARELEEVLKQACTQIKAFVPRNEKEKIGHQKAEFLRRQYLGKKEDQSWNYLTIRNNNPNALQPYREGKFFYNNLEYKKSYWKVFFRNIYLLFPGTFKKPSKVDLNQFVKKDDPISQSEGFRIQWLGHSSFLVQVNNQNILIDPVFSGFVSPCFKRYTRPGIDLESLPKIDTILISHNHVDHLDEKTLRYFVKYQPTILVPLGLKSFVQRLGFKKVHEHGWFDESVSKKDEREVRFTAVPAYHWSQPRGNLRGNESLWCGWVITANNKTLYHSGDTAFSKKVFKSINKKFPNLDYALLPIAPEDEEDMHMGIDSFFEAAKTIKANRIIPMHYLAYRMGSERVEDPYFAMRRKLFSEPNPKINILKIGEVFDQRCHLAASA